VQLNYNHQHSIERSKIERAFALFKGKWRKFRYLDVTNLSFIPDSIAAAVILHNFILDVEGDDNEEEYNNSDEEFNEHIDSDSEDEMDDGENRPAVAKRNRLAYSL
jgi:hypothetical protein